MGTSFMIDIMYFGHSCRVNGSRSTAFFCLEGVAGGRRKQGASRFPNLANKRRSEISLTGSNLPDPGENHPQPAESRPWRICAGQKSEFQVGVEQIWAGEEAARPLRISAGQENSGPGQICPTKESWIKCRHGLQLLPFELFLQK